MGSNATIANGLRVIAALAALVACSAAARAEAAAPARRILAAARAEAVKLSPALAKKLDWKRVRTVVENAGSKPEMWLARSTVL